MSLLTAASTFGSPSKFLDEFLHKRIDRRLQDDLCDPNNAEYITAKIILGEDLVECICVNAPEIIEASDFSKADVTSVCKCKNYILESNLLDNDDVNLLKSDLDEFCSDDNPSCFSRDTFAIDVNGVPIKMSFLRSGDLVKDGAHTYTRVVVNQHAAEKVSSTLLKLVSPTCPTIIISPDHVIYSDDAFISARDVTIGSKLSGHEVTHISTTRGHVINPITVSGKILVKGNVLVSTYPDWISDYMLSSNYFPLPISLCNALSYVFPNTTQAYYDHVIEKIVSSHHPVQLKRFLPRWGLPVAFLVADFALFSGFVVYASGPGIIVTTGLALLASHTWRMKQQQIVLHSRATLIS